MKTMTTLYLRGKTLLTGLVLGCGYLGVLLLAAFPVLPDLARRAVLGGNPDLVCFHIWRIWWYDILVRGLLHLPRLAPGDFITYAVVRAETFMHAGNVLPFLLLALPLKACVPFPLWWNLSFALALGLNFCAAYRLLRDFSANRTAAWVFSLVVVLNPFSFKLLSEGRLRELCYFALLECLRAAFAQARAPSWKTSLGCGLWLGLTGWLYWFYASNAVLFLGLWLLLGLPGRGSAAYGRAALGLLLALLLALVSFIPFILMYSRELATMGAYALELNHCWGQSWPLAALPSGHYPEAAGQLLHGASMMLGESVSLSWIFSALAGAGVLASLYFKPRLSLSLLALGAVFYLLALGPWFKGSVPNAAPGIERHLGAYHPQAYFRLGGALLPNPVFRAAYRYLPFFTRQIRPDRYLVMVYLVLGLLGSLGAACLARRLPRYSPVAGLLLGLLLGNTYLMELSAQGYLPLPALNLDPPGFYARLAGRPRCGVIELPLPAQALAPPPAVPGELKTTLQRARRLQQEIPYVAPLDRYHLYQTLHRQKLYGGFLNSAASFPPVLLTQAEYAYLSAPDPRGNTFITYLGYLARESGGYAPGDLKELRSLGYKYIVLHYFSDYTRDSHRLYARLKARLERSLGPACLVTVERRDPGGREEFAPLYVYELPQARPAPRAAHKR